jgi:hypothetical protein
MQTHRVVRGLMQHHREEIEAHDLAEAAAQLVEQRGQFAVRNDGFANGQQGLILVAANRCLSVEGIAWHDENPGGSPIRNDQWVLRIPDVMPGGSTYHF